MERKYLNMHKAHFLKTFPVLALATALSSAPISIEAQLSLEQSAIERIWDKASDAYEKNQFSLAMNIFEDYISQSNNPNSERHIKAEYLSAICALNLYHKDAEFRIDAFIDRYPESSYVQDAYWAIADHHYKRRHFKKAAAAFDQVNIRNLPKNKQRELRFKRGHSLFEEESFEKARL